MQGIIKGEQVEMYSKADVNTKRPEPLPTGTVVEVFGSRAAGGQKWYEVGLPDGDRVFVTYKAQIFGIKKVTLLEDVTAYSAPSTSALSQTPYRKNTKVTLMDVMAVDGKKWVKFCDSKGNEGYILSPARVKDIPTRRQSLKSLVTGAVWLAFGIIITVGSYIFFSSLGMGMYVVTYGMVVFGLVRFVQGAIQYLGAPE